MQQAHAAGARLKRAHAACACDGRAIEAPDMNTYAMVGQTEGKRENMEERKARPTLGRMVAVGVLVVAVLAAATTWARYASEVSGADTVDVATFKVSASGFEEGKDVELFTTVYELDDTTDFTAGAEEKDVAAGKVAPGTWGKFEMTLQNDSDVTVTYEVKLAYNDTAVPLEFSFDATTWKAASAVRVSSGKRRISDPRFPWMAGAKNRHRANRQKRQSFFMAQPTFAEISFYSFRRKNSPGVCREKGWPEKNFPAGSKKGKQGI